MQLTVIEIVLFLVTVDQIDVPIAIQTILFVDLKSMCKQHNVSPLHLLQCQIFQI